MDRRRFLVTAGSAATLALSGCTSGDSADYDVGMSPASFNPPEYTVEAGDEVVWKNTSSRTHTVTAYEGGIPETAAYFASGGYDSEDVARRAWQDFDGGITAGDTYSHTFEVPGEYLYFCIPHEQGGMRGTIVVEA